MTLEELQKKNNKMVIIFLIGFFSSFVPFIPGAILVDEGNNVVLGIILLVLAGILFVGSIVCIAIVSGGLNKKMNQMRIDHNRQMLSKREFKNVFTTTTLEEVEFFEEYFTVNGKVLNYCNYDFAAGFNCMTLEMTASITFFNDSGDTPLIIPLDLDLIEEIEKKNINLINKEELDFYINNFDVAYKQAKRALAIQPALFMLMEFKKNKVDAKKFGKRNLIASLFYIGSFVLFLGINILLMWLGQSKEGIEFSNKIGMDIIIKVIFTVILLLMIFVKSTRYHIVSKTSIDLYLILYWVGIFYFPGKVNVILMLIFAFLLLAIGLNELYRNKGKIDEKTGKKEEMNRFIGISMFLFLLLMFNVMEFTYVDDGLPYLVAIIIAGVITIITIICIIIYLSKHKGLEKKKITEIWLCGIIFPLIFGWILCSLTIVNLNYALDPHEPIIKYYEIIELEKGDNNSSDKAIIIIDDKEVEISISAEEYHKLEVGEELEVYYSNGAFNMPYYYHKSN